jgi:hypothetical protein
MYAILLQQKKISNPKLRFITACASLSNYSKPKYSGCILLNTIPSSLSIHSIYVYFTRKKSQLKQKKIKDFSHFSHYLYFVLVHIFYIYIILILCYYRRTKNLLTLPLVQIRPPPKLVKRQHPKTKCRVIRTYMYNMKNENACKILHIF